MSFAFNPDDKPARVIRFVPRGTMPRSNLLSLYDRKQNLLLIDEELYARLDEMQQEKLLRTHEPAIEFGSELSRLVLNQLDAFEDWPPHEEEEPRRALVTH